MSTVVELHLIAGARPNFMKVAPLYHALTAEAWCRPILVHTGQHYDANMSDTFFADLGLPAPDFHLGVGSGTHAQQTAGVMLAYEQICTQSRPQWTIVVGDVNSTLACALVAAKLCIPVAHLEAGLRSGDRTMPEEINRIVTDAVSDVLWTPSPDADANLRAEGFPEFRVRRVGNIMIDAYEMLRGRIECAATRKAFGLSAKNFGAVTLHRPVNVDHKPTLQTIVEQLNVVAARMPIVFAVHPRTLHRLQEFNLHEILRSSRHIHLTDPMGYIAFMGLVREAAFVITDSGGIQEETTYLNIPCLTLREMTERPITLEEGSNRLVDANDLVNSIELVVAGHWPESHCLDLWDGHTAGRVVADLKARLGAQSDL